MGWGSSVWATSVASEKEFGQRGPRQRHGLTGAYLVGLVGSSSSSLALVARGELGEVTVVVTLPGWLSEK